MTPGGMQGVGIEPRIQRIDLPAKAPQRLSTAARRTLGKRQREAL